MVTPSGIRSVFFGCNAAGIIILVISFTLTFGYEALSGEGREGPLMMILGPAVFVCDALYRRNILGAEMFSVERGGTILWIPAWIMGLVWTGIGAFYIMYGKS